MYAAIIIIPSSRMFEIYVKELVFAQAAKYMLIAKNDVETKRSDVCSLLTSVPTFANPILIDDIKGLVVKACTATIDRKLTVIGSINLQQIIDSNQPIIYESQCKFMQMIEQQEVCTGRCTITIKKKIAQIANKKSEQIDLDDEMILDDDPSEGSEQANGGEEDRQQNNQSEFYFDNRIGKSPADFSGTGKCQLKVIVHCGFDFYLNSGFKVCLKWGNKKKETKTVMNKISPHWGEMLTMVNNEDKIMELSVEDDRGSRLEWIRMQPNQIRIMYPYHLRVKFRQECMGAHPYFFITVIREDVPRFSILDRQIKISMKYIGSSATSRRQEYLLIYRREVEDSEAKLPIFMDLDMNHYVSFATVNSLMEKNKDKKYEWNHWNMLIPVSNGNAEPFTILKSMLNLSLVCLYFHLENPKNLFSLQLWNTVDVIERKQSFDSKLKDLYYKQKRIVLGKTVELTNGESSSLQNGDEAASLEQKWKILTQNYLLRKKLLEKSFANTEQVKLQIQQKGVYLESLKKILKEVKKMNTVMIEKERSAFVEKKAVKVKQNYQSISLVEIMSSLFEKQAELQRRKHINDQMRMRMASLQHFNEDSTELDQALLKNSQDLLHQQGMTKQMKKIKEALPKQREVIGKLEQLFQKREMDKHANDQLQKQKQKLQQIKAEKRGNLQHVYQIIKQHNKQGPKTILQEIEAAEKQLIKLNLELVRMRG